MIGRLAVASVAVAASLAGGASAAHAAPYNPRTGVDCNVSVVTHTVGQHLVFQIGALANANPQPQGTFTITLTGHGQPWSTTQHYPGHQITVQGPVVPRGNYHVSIHFTPSDKSAFFGCRGVLPFNVGVGPDNGHHHGGPGGNGTGPLGVLPDTGGPDVMWLLLGTTLMGAGATSVVVSRRRRVVLA